MLEGLFYMFILLAFVITLIGKAERDFSFSVLGAILWLLVAANSIYILVSYSTTDKAYLEYGFTISCLLFIFYNIITAFIYYAEWKEEGDIL